MKEKLFPIFFLLLGAISILGQAVLLREITALFYGNELFYGAGLGVWMLFTGLGSLWAERLKFLKNNQRIIWFILTGLSLALPILIILLRWLVAKLVPVGQLPDFWFSFFVLGTAFFVFCFLLGADFTLAVLSWQKREGKQQVNLAYLWETIGFALAGLVFSFVFSETSFPLWPKLNESTLSWRYPGLVKILNSKYNQIILTKNEEQTNFFLSGQLTFTSAERLENQQSLALITPFLKETSKVLLLANPNLAREIKNKLAFVTIDFLEIDNKLAELEKDLLIEGVNPIPIDARRFLNQTENQWDLIIFSPGNPQTLLTNRFFTKECFKQVANHLSPDGVFILSFYLPTDYQSKEALKFGSSIFQTLKNVFPKIELLVPEDQLLILASRKELEVNQAKIDPLFRSYFWYQIQSQKRKDIEKKLTQTKEKINSDFEPAAFFYQQLFWQTIFNFKIPKILLKIVNILPLSLFILLLISFVRLKKEKRLGLFMAASSFVLMSLEILIIFLFQTRIGYLYSQISLIFAAVLLGMAAGVKVTNNIKRPLNLLKLSFLGYLSILLLFFFDYEATITLSSLYWLGLAAISGLFGGMAFASLNDLYYSKSGKHPGYIYAFDLFGGCFGAFLTSSFLLPFFGVKGLILGLMGIVAFLLLPNASNSSRTT